MQTTSSHSIKDIDFQKLWQQARKKRAWSSKGAKDWDKKASSFASRNAKAPYIDLILSKLPITSDCTVLDIGSGPGTLAVPISKKASSVTAIDYSANMLNTLEEIAENEGVTNISTIQCAWEDDWQEKGVIPHDIAIASRSLNVEDLSTALEKINNYGTKFIFLADRITPTPFEPEVFAAIGREFESGPDYIYTINILYQLGVHPHVEVIELDRKIQFPDFSSALDSFRWMLKDITPEEDILLEQYLKNNSTTNNDGSVTIERKHPPRWALIWWKK